MKQLDNGDAQFNEAKINFQVHGCNHTIMHGYTMIHINVFFPTLKIVRKYRI